MKGPFATKDEAYGVAVAGECVMARDTFKWRDECWCVMSSDEAKIALSSWFNTWAVWEEIR